ncbi:MAG: hypothetical protein R3208_03095 [Ketobacteraceae bacterium]|nr:hypothetical protein [Ketobacteraceae bacterium]
MNLRTPLSAIFLVSALTACGGGGGSSDGSPAGKDRNASGLEAEVEGTWAACYYLNEAMTETELWATTMEDGVFVDEFYAFRSNDCSGDPFRIESYSGEYEVIGETTTGSGMTAIEVDWIDPTDGERCYSLVAVDDDRLYFADMETGNCSSENDRPTDVDFDFHLNFIE